MTDPVFFYLQLTEMNLDENQFFILGGAGFLSEDERQASITRIKTASTLPWHNTEVCKRSTGRCYIIDVLDDNGDIIDDFEIDENTAHLVLGVDDFEPLRNRKGVIS